MLLKQIKFITPKKLKSIANISLTSIYKMHLNGIDHITLDQAIYLTSLLKINSLDEAFGYYFKYKLEYKNINIGRSLFILRTKLNLTKAHLEYDGVICKKTTYLLEKNKRKTIKISTLLNICRYVMMSPDEFLLLGIENEKV